MYRRCVAFGKRPFFVVDVMGAGDSFVQLATLETLRHEGLIRKMASGNMTQYDVYEVT